MTQRPRRQHPAAAWSEMEFRRRLLGCLETVRPERDRDWQGVVAWASRELRSGLQRPANDDAEEVLSRAMMRLFEDGGRRWRDLAKAERPQGFLRLMARRLQIDLLWERKRQHEIYQPELLESLARPLPGAREERVAALEEALAGLDPKETFLLRLHLHGLGPREIAPLLDDAPSARTAAKRIERARRSLAAALRLRLRDDRA